MKESKKESTPDVESYFRNATRWQPELKKLRSILQDQPLLEELKWRQPCYTFQNNNVVILQSFKESCALMFFKGALLKDAKGILEKPGENSQAARRIPFTSVKEITAVESTIKSYIREAIKLEKDGLKVEPKKTAEYAIPEEFQAALKGSAALKKAFAALTPGRQRAYLLHFSQAKQSKTRQSRIEKCRQPILDGKGLND